jgi:signal transduction histidine kinase
MSALSPEPSTPAEPATPLSASIRVVVADDDEALREAVADLIAGEPGLELVGSAADADGAIELVETERPHVALVDVKMPGGGGARAAREIRLRCPETRVLALTAYEDRRTVLEMLRAGVVGYVVKGASADQVIETIHRSMRGQGSLAVEVTADVIHELVTLLERSESLTRELQALDRTKSELIQVLSHELFTPITIVQGFAATIGQRWDRLRRAEIEEMSSAVAEAGERIRRLVGNLFAAARLDREGLEATTRPVEVGVVLEAATAEFAREAPRLVVPADRAARGIRVWAEQDLAVRAVSLLLENALSFSPAGSEVELGVAAANGEVEVRVADRGPGVPRERSEQVFEAFTQADQGTARQHEGLGIGLFLARRIMSAHGGRIRYEDRPGGGSVFSLVFPAFDGPRGLA